MKISVTLQNKKNESINSRYYDTKFIYYGLLSLTTIPLFYYVFKIAHYNYGFNLQGVLLWLSTYLIIGIYIKKHNFKIPANGKINFNKLAFQKVFLTISYLSAIGITLDTLLIRRPKYVPIFDIEGMYMVFGPHSVTPISLSLLGLISLFFSGISFYFLSKAINQAQIKKKFLYSIPALLITISMAFTGKRQIILFFLLILTTGYTSCYGFSKKIIRIILLGVIFIAISLFLGAYRGGTLKNNTYTYLALRIANTEDCVLKIPRTIHAILATIYGYCGAAPEALSIFVKNSNPNYIPFSITNSLVYRNLSKVIELPSYEHNLRYSFHEPFYKATGYFPRIWATGNLQLYMEGGYIYIILWYIFLVLWYKSLRKQARIGKDISVSLSFFSTITIMHQLIFPLREPIIFLAFAWFFTIELIDSKYFKPFHKMNQIFIK